MQGKWLALCLAMFMTAVVAAAEGEKKAALNAAEAGPDFVIQGEYEGTIGPASKLGAQVIALGGGKFEAVLLAKGLPGAGWDGRTRVKLQGEAKDNAVPFTGVGFTGTIKDGVFSGTGDGDVPFQLKKIERSSPTLGATPPAGAIVLFDGTNVDEWVNGKLETENLLGVGTKTKRVFKNFTLHLEFRTPFMPESRGQGRGNSGMYLNDQYECQVLDSFGLTGENNECGGFYTLAKPKVNMALPPLSWQTYDVEFTMATYDGDKKVTPATVTLKHNGVVIHDKLQLPKNTPGGGVSDERQPGALMLQNHGDPVRFRNIWIVEKP